jgi:hypothetical protein
MVRSSSFELSEETSNIMCQVISNDKSKLIEVGDVAPSAKVIESKKRLPLRKLARPAMRKLIVSTNNQHLSEIEVTTNHSILRPSEGTETLLRVCRIVVIVVGMSFVILDVVTFGLSTVNGRFVSFIDSFENCYAFRAQQPFQPVDDSRQPLTPRKRKSTYYIGKELKLLL